MGSVDKDSRHPPINVLITGFGPFKKDYPVNPSWEIARSLPEWLPPVRAKDTSAPTSASQPPIPPVRLLVHPEPVRVNYGVVRRLVPQLWNPESHHRDDQQQHEQPEQQHVLSDSSSSTSSRPRIDLAIHIGMAGPRLFYSIERRGHRDGYVMRDVDGQVPGHGSAVGGGGDGDHDGDEAEGEVAEELLTDLDVEDVLLRWKGHSPRHVDLRISEDAGHYLCDFTYFSSLAYLYRMGMRRRVLFLHVPSDASEHSVALGRELVLQLVRSIVESELAKGGGFKVEEKEC